MKEGLPWHHEDITVFALSGNDPYYPKGAQFSAAAAESIAWHADNIDSYLYNPLFWAKGDDDSEKGRTKAALVGFADLAKLHFDDTFTNTGIQSNWERYAAGTLIGLYWASLQGPDGDVAAAHHILGVSFHAVQDFYSHSSWVTSTARRCKTYFQTSKSYREGIPLYSGAYEKPMSGAQHHHGAYSLSCSIFGREGLDGVLGTVCSGYSPMQNASMCQSYRACRGSQQVEIRATLDTPLPLPNSATIYLNPKGIALDNTLLSKVQAKNRRLVDENGVFLKNRDGMHFKLERCSAIIRSPNVTSCEGDDTLQVFAGVKDLAIRATIEWADYLDDAMQKMPPRQAAFWNRVKNTPSNEAQRARQFEDFRQLPYHFLASGPYPTGNPGVLDREAAHTSNGWYLRLRIKTADVLFAGTNADIYADVQVNGDVVSRRLDYLPTDDKEGHTTNALLVYNDFERNDDDVYTIGPFTHQPDAVRLRNQDKGAGDVFEAIYTDLVNGIEHTLTDLRQLVISVIGGNADYVGQKVRTFSAGELKRMGRETDRTLEIRGGDEGDHDIHFRITKRPEMLTAKQREKGYVAVRIQLRSLHTINESVFDRGTNSDEPFVLFQVTPLSGREGERSFAYVSEPFDDMDDDEEKDFPNRGSLYKDMVLPPEGMVVVAGKIFESDSENAFDRQTLLTEFVTNMDEATQQPAGQFLDALNASLAEDWTPQFIEIFAFQRGAYPVAGPVLRRTNLSEIGGGKASDYLQLDWTQQTELLQRGAKPVLTIESDHPHANQVLEGKWYSDNFYCGDKQAPQALDLRLSGPNGNSVEAFKTEAAGDECIGAGEKVFEGDFLNGVLTGKRKYVPPPYDRPKAQMFPDSPLDIEPDYFDPKIDPQLSLEGNWEITWENSQEGSGKAVLTKGGERICPQTSSGCWYQFVRDPASKWSLSYWPAAAGARNANKVEVGANGSLKVKWGYYHLGHWGGDSSLQKVSNNTITGGWVYQDEKGKETWTRRSARITGVRVTNGETVTTAPVGKPLTIDTSYTSHRYTARGNRKTISIDLLGEHMWGRHYVFLPWSSDLEISGYRYICADGAKYQTHWSWNVCEENGGTVGLRVNMNVWHRAQTKEHILMFDGQEVPFKLNVIGEPQRETEWQNMTMTLDNCGFFQEDNRPYSEHPIKITRWDPEK